MLSSLSDEELALKAQSDKEALGELFRRYHKRFFNLAYRFCGDFFTAEDLTSEIFWRIYRYLKTFDQTKASFKTWGYKIAVNTCLTFRNQKAKIKTQNINKKLVGEDGEEENLAETIPDPKVDLMREVEKNEVSQRIQKALNTLEEKFRLTLFLFYFEDLKYEEIAEILKMPVNTVRTNLRRGKIRMRKELQDLVKI